MAERSVAKLPRVGKPVGEVCLPVQGPRSCHQSAIAIVAAEGDSGKGGLDRRYRLRRRFLIEDRNFLSAGREGSSFVEILVAL